MNRKRNVNYTKPEDPDFLKRIKKQVGYDDRNHKFDKLSNAEEDFIDDTDSEQPQVVVLNKGDLTAEEALAEKDKINRIEADAKADLNQKVFFNKKQSNKIVCGNNSQNKNKKSIKQEKNKKRPVLSFQDDLDD